MLRAPEHDGSIADVELLRPVAWLEKQVAGHDEKVGDDEILRPIPEGPIERVLTVRTIHISVPECGIDGDTEVVRIEPCPAIRGLQWWDRLLGRSVPPGARVVTGTFRHRGAQVLDLRVEGLDEPIGTTPNHPFWSEDRQAFVRADGLVPGERLRAFRDDRRPAPLSDAPEDRFVEDSRVARSGR